MYVQLHCWFKVASAKDLGIVPPPAVMAFIELREYKILAGQMDACEAARTLARGAPSCASFLILFDLLCFNSLLRQGSNFSMKRLCRTTSQAAPAHESRCCTWTPTVTRRHPRASNSLSNCNTLRSARGVAVHGSFRGQKDDRWGSCLDCTCQWCCSGGGALGAVSARASTRPAVFSCG
jgi:hypothetical protein